MHIINKGGGKMSFTDLIKNVGFESGSFPPWIPHNAIITHQYTHSGFFASQLAGGTVNAYINQIVPIEPGQGYEMVVALSKVGVQPSPALTITVGYYDLGFNFLGYGLIRNIKSGALPDVNDEKWIEVYQTTDPAPFNATQALVLINKHSMVGSGAVIVDDVSLLCERDQQGE